MDLAHDDLLNHGGLGGLQPSECLGQQTGKLVMIMFLSFFNLYNIPSLIKSLDQCLSNTTGLTSTFTLGGHPVTPDMQENSDLGPGG